MKRIKKLVSAVVAATFMFSLGAPAAFAKTSDEAVNRLKALGTVTGYTDGSVKLDQNITRAEFAAIAVRALGLENAAALSKGATQFKDVTGSHWASGYINLAVDRGIVTGYPDKSFKPEANITNAEAIAMVVRTLGYEQALEGGSWPTKYISKAAYLDLLDNVSINDYNAKATRGNVFMIMDDALETNIWKLKETSDGKQTWGEGGLLMTEKLKVEEKKDLTVDNVLVPFGGIANDEVTLSGDDYELAKGLNPMAFYGLNVKAYVKSDENKVVSLSADEDAVFTDKVKAVTNLGGGIFEITFQNHTKEKTTVATKFINQTGSAAFTGAEVVAGDKVTVAMDNGKISKFIRIDLTAASNGIVEEVKGEKIYFDDAADAGAIDLAGKDMDYVQIIRNGQPATLADIKAGDVVSYFENGDKYTIFATDAKVTGTLKSVGVVAGDTLKLTIDDKTVVTEHAAEYSTNGGDSYKAATQENLGKDLVGKTVTVRCNANGEAVYVVGSEKGTTNEIKAIIRNVVFDDNVAANNDDVVKYVKVTKLDGTETVYTIDNDDYTVNGGTKYQATLDLDGNGTLAAGDFAYLTLDANGKVTNIDKVTEKGDDSIALNGKAVSVNKDRDILTVDGKAYIVTADTKVFTVDEYGNANGVTTLNELNKTTWSAIEESGKLASNGYVWADGSELVAIFVDTDDAGTNSDKLWGMTFGGKTAIGGGDYEVKVWENGATKNYVLTDSKESDFPAANNKLVNYTVNGDGKIDTIETYTGSAEQTVTKVEKVNGKLLVSYAGGQFVAVADQVKFFDFSSGTMVSADSISKDDVVVAYDLLDKDGDVVNAGDSGDGVVDVFVIVK